MTETLGFTSNQGLVDATPATPTRPTSTNGPLRPATKADIDQAHVYLMEAIHDSPYYSERFKRHESKRLSKAFLKGLIAADPHHVFIIQAKDNTDKLVPAGVMVSGPECGTLWLYWTYITPKFRRGALAVSTVRSFLEHWDDGRFHKVSTYTRPDNRAAIAIMKRFKFEDTCLLKNHVFGEDYLLYERPLTKTEPGYDSGMGMGTLGKIKQYLLGLIGR